MIRFAGKGKKIIVLCIMAMAVMCGTALAANIDATVPASLPISVEADGSIVTANNAVIRNYGSTPIRISEINVTTENGWEIKSKEDIACAAIGDKSIAMAFNNSWVSADGTVDVSQLPRIPSNNSLSISYNAQIPSATEKESEQTVATSIFVVKEVDVPVLAPGSTWYKGTESRKNITKISLVNEYTPTSEVDERWAADVNNTGEITCYRIGTELIVVGDGAGRIKANADSSRMFSNTNNSEVFGCLTAIDNLSLVDFSDVTNASYMFASCSGLTTLNLSSMDTSNIKTISNIFYSCNNLTSLTISSWNTAKIENMSFAFYGCSSLRKLDLNSWDMSTVTTTTRMFGNCSALTDLQVDSWNTPKLTNTTYMFYGCSGITSLDLSQWDVSNVTTTAYMFYNCTGLQTLNLTTWNTAQTTSMAYMFSGCQALTTIRADKQWSVAKVVNSSSMFSGCVKLKGDIVFNSSYVDKTYAKITGGYLTGPIDPPTLASGSSWYKGTAKRNTITKICFKSSYTPTTTPDETWNADQNSTGSIKCYRIGTELIIVGNGADTIKANTNSAYAFSYTTYGYEFSLMSTIENLSMLDVSQATTLNHMFYRASGLTSLDLSSFKTSSATDLGYMFAYCSALKSLDMSTFETSKVIAMTAMFDRCSGLTNIDVSSFDTSNVTNTSGMFRQCTGLTQLDISSFNTAKIANMSYMFSGAKALTRIYASSLWSVSSVTSSSSMFSNCTKLSGDIAYSSSSTDKTYAKTSGGYLTYKAATSRTLSLQINPENGAVIGFAV